MITGASSAVSHCAINLLLLRVFESSGAYLDEPDILALLPKALTAEVEAVLADETGRVCTDATMKMIC